MARLPDFLIIGAMKAGTTTLYDDLSQHPDLYLSALKELAILSQDAVLTPEGLRDYARHFKLAKASQLCGEASTQYTKMPQFNGSALRAQKTLGNKVKIIYAVRHPIDRIRSHYVHEYSRGATREPFANAIRSDERYIAFSSYDRQVRPWLETFGADSVRILVFESYFAKRAQALQQVYNFLGVGPHSFDAEPSSHRNNSATQARLGARLTKITMSHWYRELLRPLVPEHVRTTLQRRLGRPAEVPDTTLDEESRAWLADQLRGDVAAFERTLGLERALWRLEEDRGLASQPPAALLACEGALGRMGNEGDKEAHPLKTEEASEAADRSHQEGARS